jgi:hypothetical protein
MNKAQLHFHQNKWWKNIILKSRQLGFTTYSALDEFDDTLWKPNTDSLFISYDKDSALDIFDNKILLAWQHYPKSLSSLYRLDTERANKLKFDFGNDVYSSFSVKTSGRSGTYNKLHVSEMGKICKIDPKKSTEIIAGTIPALPINGQVTIESTAEGEFGDFHDMFWDAWDRGKPRNRMEYKAFFYNWTWDTEEINKITQIVPLSEMDNRDYFRDYQKEHKITDLLLTYYYLKWVSLFKKTDILRQEYPFTPEEAFVSSGIKLFNQDNIASHKRKYGRDPEIVGDFKIYDKFIKGHYYILGADVSEGVGLDSSTITVIDLTYRPKVVATFKDNRIDPKSLAHKITALGRMYDYPMAGVENNNHGYTTLVELKDLYPNGQIYKTTVYDRELDKERTKLGWITNGASKPKMFYDFATDFENGMIEVPDRAMLSEMRTYDKEELNKTGKVTEDTKHWDLLTSAVICYQMRASIIITTTAQKKIEKKDKELEDLEFIDLFKAI